MDATGQERRDALERGMRRIQVRNKLGKMLNRRYSEV